LFEAIIALAQDNWRQQSRIIERLSGENIWWYVTLYRRALQTATPFRSASVT